MGTAGSASHRVARTWDWYKTELFVKCRNGECQTSVSGGPVRGGGGVSALKSNITQQGFELNSR